MKRPENDKWLDKALSETIGPEKLGTDFEEWKQKHPEAVELLASRASREVLGEIERSQTMSIRNRSWKYAATVALICTGVVAATVVGVKIHKYHFIDKHPKLGYLLQSEDGQTVTNVPESWADNPEHAVEVKEELDILKQQGNRKLVGVVETEVNGQLDSRWLSYEYHLSNGQMIETGEFDPDNPSPGTLTSEQREEFDQLWHEQLNTENWQKFITIEEKQMKGRVFSFTKWRLVLSDGTEVIYSHGKLK
ncbi:MAG: hypothetical protein WAV28_06035 [Sedimentisphaerales bacterium]